MGGGVSFQILQSIDIDKKVWLDLWNNPYICPNAGVISVLAEHTPHLPYLGIISDGVTVVRTYLPDTYYNYILFIYNFCVNKGDYVYQYHHPTVGNSHIVEQFYIPLRG